MPELHMWQQLIRKKYWTCIYSCSCMCNIFILWSTYIKDNRNTKYLEVSFNYPVQKCKSFFHFRLFIHSNDVHIDLLKQIISHIFSAWSSFIFRDFNHLDLDFSRDLETFWNFWLHPREQKWGLYQGRFQMRCQKRLKSHVFIIIILSLDNGAGTYYCLNMVVSQWPHGQNEMELTAQSHQSKIFRHFRSFWPILLFPLCTIL